MLTLILSAVFGTLTFLLLIGAFVKMYLKPLIDKKRGNLDVLADNRDFKCIFNKKSKKVKITCRANYANTAKAAITELLEGISKVDLPK